MDDNNPKENPPADFNKLDLSQLQSFSFGTQWTQEKPGTPDERRERGGAGDRPRRDDGNGPDRRDRRSFRRPAGAPGPGGGAGAPGGGGPATERRDFPGDRHPRREAGGEYRGGPRREGGYGGERGPRYGQGGRPQERGPYDSPYYNVTFYPEDSSFNTLVQTIRKSCRTVELFEIARTVVAKTDRFVVVMTHKPAEPAARRGEPTGKADSGEAPKARPVFHISGPDGIPFETDDAAIAHVLSNHLDKFFDTAEVEVDPPKGNFQVINKCGITGELLGPPNYHRYNQIVQQHHAAKIGRMSLEAYRSRIETLRDPEAVAQWLAKMKKATRYTWKMPPPKPGSGVTAPAVPAPDATAPETTEDSNASGPSADPGPVVPAFDTLEDARVYLLTQARDKVVRTSETARFHGKVAETIPPGEIRRAVEGALERQRRFPLDTANALRGRLRREHFTIFKKGSKGISYVCAVKRKFRVPGQTFADSIGALIAFIEANPMTRASELAGKFLGLAQPMPPKAEVGMPVAGETPGSATESKPEPELSIEDRARFARMQNDLMWLVREGYVTEFIDGRLFAPPPMVEARKKEIESEEHDPENFPDVPAHAGPGSGLAAESEASGKSPVPADAGTPPPVEEARLAPAAAPTSEAVVSPDSQPGAETPIANESQAAQEASELLPDQSGGLVEPKDIGSPVNPESLPASVESPAQSAGAPQEGAVSSDEQPPAVEPRDDKPQPAPEEPKAASEEPKAAPDEPKATRQEHEPAPEGEPKPVSESEPAERRPVEGETKPAQS